MLALRVELRRWMPGGQIPASVADILKVILLSLKDLQKADEARRDQELKWKMDCLAKAKESAEETVRLVEDHNRLKRDYDVLRRRYERMFIACLEPNTN